MPSRTITVKKGGITSTISLNREVDAGVNTITTGYVFPALNQQIFDETHYKVTRTDNPRNWVVENNLANDTSNTQHRYNTLVNLYRYSKHTVGKFRVTFDVELTSGSLADIGSTYSIRFSYRDKEADSTDGSHIASERVTEGSNVFDIELFDDGDNANPTIYLAHNKDGNYEVNITNLKVTHNFDQYTVDRTPSINTSTRVGESKPLLSKVGGATLAFALYDLYQRNGNPKICKVEKRAVGSPVPIASKTFTARNLISELEEFIGVGYDGYVVVWYNQAPDYNEGEGVISWQSDSYNPAPKIVSNGSVVRDPQGKFAIDGKGARMKLAMDDRNQANNPQSSLVSHSNMASRDGSFSLFLVGNFPSYSSATRNNVQILNLQTNHNGGANNPRKPFITINKSFNKVGSSVGTFTVGGVGTGNVYGSYVSGSDVTELITNIANPTKSTDNNTMWLDGVFRTTTNDNTVANTNDELNRGCYLFDSAEDSVTTHISSMIYYPSDKLNAVDYIHSNLLNQHDIT